MEQPYPIKKEVKIVKKAWGTEYWLENNDEYCGKILDFDEGAELSNHMHIKKRESWWVEWGQIELFYFDYEFGIQKSMILNSGETVEIPRLTFHKVKAIKQSRVFEISTTHSDSDSYRISPSKSGKSV